jgi:hypothetical protein
MQDLRGLLSHSLFGSGTGRHRDMTHDVTLPFSLLVKSKVIGTPIDELVRRVRWIASARHQVMTFIPLQIFYFLKKTRLGLTNLENAVLQLCG